MWLVFDSQAEFDNWHDKMMQSHHLPNENTTNFCRPDEYMQFTVVNLGDYVVDTIGFSCKIIENLSELDIPTKSSTRTQIMNYLRLNNIKFSKYESKSNLLEKIDGIHL